jgi:octaprenyl-diphosphate synthase
MRLPLHTGVDSAFKLIDSELSYIRELVFSSVHDDTSCAVRNVVSSADNILLSGKMLRPALLLLSAKTVGRITEKHISVAAIVEIIHNATLLHDDVIDEGQQRRGTPTVNSLCGNESAVLLGDFLLSKAFMMCADIEPRVIKIISAAAVRICEGELRQITQKQNWQMTESEYIDIIAEKTACLFKTCCQLGGLLAGADKTTVHALSGFGQNLGIAFQITDDVLDIIGSESREGKTLGSDADQNTPTLPMIHLLSVVEKSKRDPMIANLITSAKAKSKLREILKSHGSLEYACNRARQFVAKAVDELAVLKSGDAKEALIEVARFVVDRVTIS